MEDTSSVLTYFFFDSRDAQGALQKHQQLICSLIWQLCSKYGTIPADLVRLYGDGQQPLKTELLQNILQSIIAMNKFIDVYIIIDSLDECTESKEVLGWIKGVLDWGKQKVHLLITSRKGEQFEDQLQLLDPLEVLMDAESVEPDIKLYIETQIQLNKMWSSYKVQSLIRTTLLEKSAGMYVYP